MNIVPTPLGSAELIEHARAAAESDEQRHSEDNTVGRANHHAEHTIRGWGAAALLDLEWASHCVYGKAQKDAYRGAYATEYQRLRAERNALRSGG